MNFNLTEALTNAKTLTDFNDIFNNEVKVELGTINDKVTIKGYEGVVSTDFIAHKILYVCSSTYSEDSKKLAKLLANKVFTPLKDLVESPDNQCAFYQVSALVRYWSWSRSQSPEFGQSTALKHAVILAWLDRGYKTWVDRYDKTL